MAADRSRFLRRVQLASITADVTDAVPAIAARDDEAMRSPSPATSRYAEALASSKYFVTNLLGTDEKTSP
jgi:hypothetical protein